MRQAFVGYLIGVREHCEVCEIPFGTVSTCWLQPWERQWIGDQSVPFLLTAPDIRKQSSAIVMHSNSLQWKIFSISTKLAFFFCLNAPSYGHQGSVWGPLQRVWGECHILRRRCQRAARWRRTAAGGHHEADPGACSQSGACYLWFCRSLPSFWLWPAYTCQWLSLTSQGNLCPCSHFKLVRPYCNTFSSIFSPHCEKLLSSPSFPWYHIVSRSVH